MFIIVSESTNGYVYTLVSGLTDYTIYAQAIDSPNRETPLPEWVNKFPHHSGKIGISGAYSEEFSLPYKRVK